MGAMETQLNTQKVTRNLFCFMHIIGRGGFGKVWKVSYKKGNGYFALKEMSKAKIIDRKSERSVMSERTLLGILHNPFIVNMMYSFQDYDYLYLIGDLMTGGDLRFHIGKYKRFNEEQTKFFMACIILGLEYIHESGVIHRDIKPENLVLDEKGYVRITDFGIARKYYKDNEYDTSGTPGYMAPEVLCSQSHSFTVDYFALGVIGYEFMFGSRPYHGRSRREIKQNVLAMQVQIKPNETPMRWSIEASNLINQLLQRKPGQRLGANGIVEIKNHPWFSNISWDDLYNKTIPSPFIPKKGDNFDRKYCDYEEKVGLDTQERYKLYRANENYDSLFYKYTFNNISQEEFKIISSPISTNSTKSSPGEKRLKYYYTSSPLKIKLHYTPKQSCSIYQRSKHKGIYLANGQGKKGDKSFSKESLPIINPNHNSNANGNPYLNSNQKSMQKSFSSMSIYKTNNFPSAIRKSNKDNNRLFLKKQSPVVLVKKMSNNILISSCIDKFSTPFKVTDKEDKEIEKRI